MEVLHLEGTEETPQVTLDKKKGLFEISGRSLPEDASSFYKPVIRWIDSYALGPNPVTEFIFKLDYFNTASSKLILDLLSALEKVGGTTIHWYFNDDDEDMEEAGEDFSELVKIPFVFKTYD
jgi:hypothetical protein